MLKQTIYNYIDHNGTKWNTSDFNLSDENAFKFPNTGLEVKRFSLQAPPGTIFSLGTVQIVMSNSGIFNYDQPINAALTFGGNTKWFILDYELGKIEGEIV